MALSRLSNFLKNVKGNIIYVDPNSLDSTDSIENQGNSLTRPFKTIQRALIEAARFSYQRGKKNDRFLKTTILLYPGEHYIDNRPGWIPSGQDQFTLRGNLEINATIELDFESNFDIFDSSNDLYPLNSIYGGVIVPRGTSIVGLDLRKTKLRPLYVPNPENDDIERSALFRVTGGCYFWQFTILDGDPNGLVFRDYTANQTVPNFSHHKLTVFEYADGVNNVNINDEFLNFSTDRTDLDMFYQKIGLAYGQGAGRPIGPDYPSEDVDIEPVVDEFRVVGSKGLEVGISEIFSGNKIVGSTEITVILDEPVDQLSVDTPIQIQGASLPPGYAGQYAVAEVINDTTFKYVVASVPVVLVPDAAGTQVSITVDTVSSASPYIFNCSLRSVYGMCGLHADGNNATGFRSMVVAQYTGIGLQKDDNAFVKYNKIQGIYEEGGLNAHTNSLSRFKPDYENYHIRASNNAFLQLVSVFAIGFANHFLAESGGDHSITNSNSNFGAKSLISKGFRDSSFERDDCGYITHIVTPKEITDEVQSIEYLSIDAELTDTVNQASRLYLYDETDANNPPDYILNGYKIGANTEEKLYLQINNPTDGLTIYDAEIVMGNTENTAPDPAGEKIRNIVGEKIYRVGRSSAGINTITNNTIEFAKQHTFRSGESVVAISANDTLPDGLESNKIYYAININNKEIKLSSNQEDAINGDGEIFINNKGGVLDIVSRVTDKKPGEPGSPFVYDNTRQNWYLRCNPLTNNIFTQITSLYPGDIGAVTSRTFIRRKPDKRSNTDKIFKFRYVLPKGNENDAITCRPPIDGYVMQESSDTLPDSSDEISKYFAIGSQELIESRDLRNFRFIANASWSSNTATIQTEIPHNLKIGSIVDIYNIISDNNTDGSYNSGFNGEFEVVNVVSSNEFSYLLTSNPGNFGNNTNLRNPDDLPRYINRKYRTTYQIFTSDEIQTYEKGKVDGIYHITMTNASNNPSVSPFRELSFSQPIQNLYPQLNRDNPNSDPDSSSCFALPDPIGQVSINDPRKSITKETLFKGLEDLGSTFNITDIKSTTGTSHTIYTELDHNLSSVLLLDVTEPGSNYSDGVYYNVPLVGSASSTTGQNCTAIITVDSGAIQSPITILNGGSAYGIGNTLVPVRTGSNGISTNSFWTNSDESYFTVSSVNDPSGLVLNITGISSHFSDPEERNAISEYNGNYVVSSVANGETNAITVESEKTLDELSTISGSTSNASVFIVGKSLNVSSLSYDSNSGVGTVGFTTTHPFKSGTNITLYGATDSFFNNKNFTVTRVNSQLEVRLNMGKSDTAPTLGGTIKALPTLYTSNDGDLNERDEYASARLNYTYGGFTGYVSTQLNSTDPASTQLQLYSALNQGLKLGDYLLIGNEIVRISQRVSSNNISIIRSLLGTRKETHLKDDVVQKILVYPVEFRRNSILRASGHTFEYLGFGPGNYSTGLPEKQDRILTPQEEILSQATKIDGGTIQYTGMNSDGDFYNNNRKLTSTGKDQIFEAPIPTVTGEEPIELAAEGGFNLSTPEEVVVGRSIRIDGGKENNLVSEINGPAVFNEKITSTSDKGVELRKLNIRSDLDISREIGISTTKPSNAGNIGDVALNASPVINSNVGWIYATDELDNQPKWTPYGWINESLYGVDFSSTGVSNAKISRLLNFVGSGINIVTDTDDNSGVSTVTFTQSVAAANQVGVITGTDTENIPPLGAGGAPDDATVQVLKFVGSDLGFGVSLNAEYGTDSGDPTGVGIATIKFTSPIVPLNFGDGTELPGTGTGAPVEGATTNGTRVIYDESFGLNATNYAVGRDGNTLWWSVAQNVNSYGFRWYGGQDLVSSFINQSGVWTWNVTGVVDATSVVRGNTLESTVADGTAPLTVNSSTQVISLNSSFLQGREPDVNNINDTIPLRQPGAVTSQIVISGITTGLLDSTGIGRDGAYYEDISSRLGYTPFDSAGGTIDGVVAFKQISDFVNTSSTTAANTISVDFQNGPIFRTTGSLTGISVLNITNVPTTANRSYNYTLIVNATSTTDLPVGLEINNGAVTSNIRWLNNNTPPATSNPANTTYIIGFTFFCDGSGSFTTPGNTVLGVFGQYS